MTLSKADSNEEKYSKTKQTIDRILRARDIIPAAPKSDSEKPAKELATDIPKFDLADEIMTKHREITAIKRKAPGKKIETPGLQQQAKPTIAAMEQPITTLSQQRQIIADIVARDIEKLCSVNIIY